MGIYEDTQEANADEARDYAHELRETAVLEARPTKSVGTRGDIYDRLGLRRPSPFRGMVQPSAGEWRDIGTTEVRFDGELWATVRVEISEMPAVFFRFTITPAIEDVQAVTLETGSGKLDAYWPSVLLFAGGMIHARVPA